MMSESSQKTKIQKMITKGHMHNQRFKKDMVEKNK